MGSDEGGQLRSAVLWLWRLGGVRSILCATAYRLLVPLTTMSTLRLPQPAHTSRAFQSRTVV
jgi:hypothetical protein